MFILCHIHRADYNPDQYLWEKEFSLAGRTYQRQDLEASIEYLFYGLLQLLLPIYGRYITIPIVCVCTARFIYFVIVQLKNARGYTLKCSHYLPFPFPEDTSLPCVIYCHGNRYVLLLWPLLLVLNYDHKYYFLNIYFIKMT